MDHVPAQPQCATQARSRAPSESQWLACLLVSPPVRGWAPQEDVPTAPHHGLLCRPPQRGSAESPNHRWPQVASVPYTWSSGQLCDLLCPKKDAPGGVWAPPLLESRRRSLAQERPRPAAVPPPQHIHRRVRPAKPEPPPPRQERQSSRPKPTNHKSFFLHRPSEFWGDC